METVGMILLWVIGAGLLLGGAVLWLVDGEASRVGGTARSRLPKVMVVVGGVLAIMLLTACAPTVLSTPNSCTTLIPETWRAGVPGVPLPANDTIGEWIAFGDGQTGKLDIANGRTADTIGIIERCEARDAKAVKRATRPWWRLW